MELLFPRTDEQKNSPNVAHITCFEDGSTHISYKFSRTHPIRVESRDLLVNSSDKFYELRMMEPFDIEKSIILTKSPEINE